MAGKTSWHHLPAEIRSSVLAALLQSGCHLASFATVSREWQTSIEHHNFARIRLTPSRVADFNLMTRRNRSLVRYIWLCLELDEYDCTECSPDEIELWGLSNADNTLIITALQDLFSALSAWEPDGDLLLDVSVYSPSDSEHWFKYLTIMPDVPPPSERQPGWCAAGQQQLPMPLRVGDDPRHGWVAGTRDSAPTYYAIYRISAEIMGEGPFEDDEQENQWWQQLPLVPAVTGVLLRQQTRRRWKPRALAQMLARLPGLQEIHYEPWREWESNIQRFTDYAYRTLLDSLASNHQLRRLVLFESFNQQYPLIFHRMRIHTDPCCDPIRIPTPDVSRAAANASLNLEHLSASFMVDASYFFDAREPSWKWPNLTSLVLTSRLLAPDASPIEMDDMLRMAAAAAMKMPNLETMEIWNGQEGLAMLFKYQPAGRGQPAVITCRGSWVLDLRPPVIEAWEAVAVKLRHRGSGLTIVKELLDVGAVESHGDAIHHLRLSKPVVRPVSLQQIQMEHRLRGMYS